MVKRRSNRGGGGAGKSIRLKIHVGRQAKIGSHDPSMQDHELISRIETGRRAVLSQTALMHRDFGRAASNWKADGTRVTPVDIAISESIQKDVLGAHPADQFFSEELADAEAPIPVTSRYCWMLDPIDGTNNYALGIAHCAIALALFDRGMPVYGFVYDMSRHSLIEGGPGFGVRDGERVTKVNDNEPNPQSLIGFHSPYDKRFSPAAQKLVENAKIRGLGSSTLHLAYVAAGILDGVVDHNVRLWDIAAAVPMVWAAGGETRFLNGEQFPLKAFDLKMPRIYYIAGSTRMCDHLLRVLKD